MYGISESEMVSYIVNIVPRMQKRLNRQFLTPDDNLFPLFICLAMTLQLLGSKRMQKFFLRQQNVAIKRVFISASMGKMSGLRAALQLSGLQLREFHSSTKYVSQHISEM